MSKQPEALRLAEWCETFNHNEMNAAAAELRRLHEENKRIASAEREACAKVCDDLAVPPHVTREDASIWEVGTLDCAEAIRARGQA